MTRTPDETADDINPWAAHMEHVFFLWHTHGVDEDQREENLKLIGAYSSETEAQAAKVRKLQCEGLCDAPDGFSIEKVKLNEDRWPGGYATMYPGEVRSHRH